MKRPFQLLLIFASIFVVSIFSSCEDKFDNNDLIQSAVDNAICLDLFDDISRQANLYQYGATANCPQVTVSTPPDADYPRGIIIDYNPACIGPFNRERSGRIIINQNAPYTEPGMVQEVTLEDYMVDGIRIQGFRKLQCTGTNPQGYPQYNVSDSLGMLVLQDELTIRHTAQFTRVWTGGSDTPDDFDDDVWQLTGEGNGNNRDGYDYSFEITEAMFFDMRCGWKMTQGRMNLRAEGRNADLDFGSGGCDNAVYIITDETEETIYF